MTTATTHTCNDGHGPAFVRATAEQLSRALEGRRVRSLCEEDEGAEGVVIRASRSGPRVAWDGGGETWLHLGSNVALLEAERASEVAS